MHPDGAAEPGEPRGIDWAHGISRYRRKSRTALRLLTGAVPAEVGQGPRVARWESRSEWPLAFAALVFLAAYAAQVLAQPTGAARLTVNAAIWVTWLAFAADYILRVALARRRLVYAARHWFDLLIIALPVLRPLRVLRVVMLVRMLNRKAASSMRGRVVVYGAFTAVLLLFCASLAVLQAERANPSANIKSFGDALWWSVVTMCTVGYGDKYPMTGEGRLVGVGLMVTGVGLFGAVTASFATWLVDQLRDEEDAARAATQRDLESLKSQLDRIERALAASTGGSGGDGRGPAPGRRNPSARRRGPERQGP